jgi:ABC-type Mn2+/Zn2+ transport system ATPase subunit
MTNASYAIEIRDLCFSYDNQKDILRIPQFKLHQSEKCFLYGPSGYGKSTLLNLITGVLPQNTGSLKVLGQDFLTISGGKKIIFVAKKLVISFKTLT